MLAVLLAYEKDFSFEECLHYRQVAKIKLKDTGYINTFITNKIKVNYFQIRSPLKILRRLRRPNQRSHGFSRKFLTELVFHHRKLLNLGSTLT